MINYFSVHFKFNAHLVCCAIAKNGHCIPPSPGIIEHNTIAYKKLKNSLLSQNIRWFKLSVFSGSRYPSFPKYNVGSKLIEEFKYIKN